MRRIALSLRPILSGALAVMLAMNTSGCLYPQADGQGGGSGGGGGGGGQSHSDTYIGAHFPDARFEAFGRREGVTIKRHDYAPDAMNAKGVPCRRFADFYHPEGAPRGIFLLFHGGGFDVGGADFKGQAFKAKSLSDRGYLAVNVEYRRGWTEAQYSGADRDVFDSSPEEYARLLEAAMLAVEDARLAVAYIREQAGPGLPMYMEGTSAGGTIVLYVMLADASWRTAQGIEGGICGYGGIAAEDFSGIGDLDVPLLMAGGMQDTRVPFDEGWYFQATGKSERGVGIGKLYDHLAARGAPVRLVATCNAGHTYGALEEDEVFDLFFDLIEDFEAGRAGLPERSYHMVDYKSRTSREVARCE